MIKRLIFDVDGTLIVGTDFTPYVEKALRKHKIYSPQNVDKVFQALHTYESKYDNYNEEDFINYLESFLEINIDRNFLSTFFYELKNCVPSRNQKLIETISNLSKKYELVLLTNFFGASQLNRLNTMKIGKYFKEVHGEKKIKPNPESYLCACGNHKPEECVMIGDSLEKDIKGAKDVGIHTVYINYQGIKEKFSDASISTVEEINDKLIESLLDN